MRRTVNTKARRLLATGIAAVLLATTTVVVVWGIATLRQSLRTMQASDRVAAELGSFASAAALLQQEHSVLLKPDQGAKRSASSFSAAADRLRAIDAAAAGPEAAAGLQQALTACEQEVSALRSRIAGDAAAPPDPARNAGSNACEGMQTLAAARVSEYQARVSAAGAALDDGIARHLGAIGLALVAGLIAVVIGLRLVYEPIAAEVQTLARVCDAVVAGDLTSRVPSPDDSEIGHAGRSLNAMLDSTMSLVNSGQERDRMQAAVMKLLEEVSGVAEGDLTIQAEVTADVTGAVADSFNVMIGQLRHIIGQRQAASPPSRAAAPELRDVTDPLASGSDDQAAQAVEASVAIEEMAASIHYVSENASSSASVAEQARVNAEHGTRAVTRTIDGMKAVREQVQETALRIKRLGESSQEIGEIVELIGDIGDRTSILALNASIQAAMAGESGRGFAIVADEVERLADRATEATKRAGTLVKTTQTEAAEVMAAMEDTTREVINRSNIANEAGVALTQIQGVSNRLAELIQAISDAAQQQARGSEQVAKSMNEMSAVTRNTAASSKQTAAAINSLTLLVDNLNDIVSRFKLPGAPAAPAVAGAAAGEPAFVPKTQLVGVR